MNDNTEIYCHLKDAEIAANFDWNTILDSSGNMEKSPCNASAYILEDGISICALEKFICIRPSEKEVLDKVAKRLKELISRYYGCKANVTVDPYQSLYKVDIWA
ncbi:MAG: hypothetical protein ACOYBL_10095 [Lachnospiraceae bacterium]|jgi:hypothetical protein